MAKMSFKIELLSHIEGKLTDKKNIFLKDLHSLKLAKASDTKSSVGDKYETGRAMIHLEEEKMHSQIVLLESELAILKSVDKDESYNHVKPGAMITAGDLNIFISIPMGKIMYKDIQILVISPVSPLGKVLFGKREGDEFPFMGRSVIINSIQ